MITRTNHSLPWQSALLAATLAVGAGPAVAGNNRSAPAPHAAAAPHVGGFGGGGAHMPGGFGGGGAHLPGGMGGGGAHLPGGMAGGGAHLPGGMGGGGAHLPGGMAGGAHVPGGMAGGAHVPGGGFGAAHAPAGLVSHAPGGLVHAPEAGRFGAAGRPGGPAFGGGREAGARPGERGGAAFGGREAGGREGGARFGGEAHGFGGAGHDPRIGGGMASHTHGLEAGMGHHEARPFMHPDAHRDIGRDRAFAAEHRGDFHTRDVRGFSAREMHAWRGGDWRREWHYGREGWWWEVDGVWYPYAEPIWPYPLEVSELTVYDTPYVDGPDPSMIVADGRQITIPPLPAAPAGRYRCDEPRGFYPSVATCSVPWELVADALPAAQANE